MGWPAFLNLTFYLSLLTVGVGFLSGRGGLVFGLGGFLCYWLLSPLLIHFGAPDVQALAASKPALAVPNAFRGALFRPLGIGILIGAAIGGIVAALPLIVSAVRSMQDAAKEKAGAAGGTSTAAATSDELPIQVALRHDRGGRAGPHGHGFSVGSEHDVRPCGSHGVAGDGCGSGWRA